MKIILLSDTHITQDQLPFPAELLDHLRDASLILHAGDITTLEVLKWLQNVAVTNAVHGNQDEPEVVERLPATITLTAGGRSIGLIHGHRPDEIEDAYRGPGIGYDSPEMEQFYDYLLAQLPDSDIIVFGHFHEPLIRTYRGRMLVNPGTAAPHKDPRTIAVLETGQNGPEVNIVAF